MQAATETSDNAYFASFYKIKRNLQHMKLFAMGNATDSQSAVSDAAFRMLCYNPSEIESCPYLLAASVMYTMMQYTSTKCASITETIHGYCSLTTGFFDDLRSAGIALSGLPSLVCRLPAAAGATLSGLPSLVCRLPADVLLRPALLSFSPIEVTGRDGLATASVLSPIVLA